jgi:hypothetical protein
MPLAPQWPDGQSKSVEQGCSFMTTASGSSESSDVPEKPHPPPYPSDPRKLSSVGIRPIIYKRINPIGINNNNIVIAERIPYSLLILKVKSRGCLTQ